MKYPGLFLALGLLTSCHVDAQVINEFVANHTGTDNYSFVEVSGLPSTDYSRLTLLEVAGDTNDGPGTIANIWVVGATDVNGIWVSAFGAANVSGDIDNGSNTLLLVSDFTGSLNQDLDSNDDGSFDSTPWTAVADDISVSDGGSLDLLYSPIVLSPGFDSITFTPGGASRLPNGTDTDLVADWKRNDFSGQGLPGFADGSLDAGEVANSPGSSNLAGPAAPLGLTPKIDEFVIDHIGSDTEERIEVWGQISQSYAQMSVLIIDSDSNGSPGEITHVYPVGTTNGGGLWSTPTLAPDTLSNQSTSIFLVAGFSGSAGDDLDTNDDGSIDATPPWTDLFDDIAVADGNGADLFYSAVVLRPGYDAIVTPVWGASRIPSGVDSDSIADWRRNDFAGAGLSFGSDGTLNKSEAWNSPGMINLVREEDYWHGVDTSTAALLRETIHQHMDDHQRFAYSSNDADTWDILELADQDPLDQNRVVAIYKNESYAKFGGGTGPYNREHSWPQSYGFPDDALSNSPRSDAQQLFISNVAYNGSRSNLPFGTCNAGCSEQPTLPHNGFGGLGGPYPGDSNWYNGGAYEVWNHRRGDIARALLYLDLRYEGGNHNATGFAEPDLVLTDDTSLIQTSGGSNTTGIAYMGRLSTLLDWHLEDPVDEGERRRNDIIWMFQGNRNPFIDHPEWTACVFDDECESDVIFSNGFE